MTGLAISQSSVNQHENNVRKMRHIIREYQSKAAAVNKNKSTYQSSG